MSILFWNHQGGGSTGLVPAFTVVLDQVAFLVNPNQMRFVHLSVVDTSLSEFAVSPTKVGWLDNIVKFKHIQITE